jgi:AAA family ATP:ADP antiporter
MSKRGAFSLVLSQRYLLLIAVMILLLNWVNTTGGYLLDRTFKAAAAEAELTGAAGGLSAQQLIGQYSANFLSTVNVVGLLAQLFVVSRVIKYFGVRIAVLILPIIALGGYSVLAFYPVFAAVRVAKTAENATDYSLQNTLRGILFLPTTREEKYKAKQAIDSFFVRVGDVLSAALIFVGTTYLAFQTQHFAMVNLVLVILWLVVAVMVGREYQRRSRTEGVSSRATVRASA